MRKFIILLLLFFLSFPIFAQEKPNIAVIDFQGQNISAMDASIISGFIRSRLVTSKEFRIIDKANMDVILAEQGFQQTGCTTQDCAVQMGKILNVQKMINGNVSRLLDTYYITANCIDVETGEIQFSENIEFKAESMLKQKTEEIANNLIIDLTSKNSNIKKAHKVREKSKILYKAGIESLIPGNGQFYNKQKIKGGIVRGSFILSASLTVVSRLLAESNWNNYINATESYNANFYYNRTILYDKATVYSALTTVTIWLCGIADAFITENVSKKTVIDSSGKINIQFSSYFDNDRISIVYNKLFE